MLSRTCLLIFILLFPLQCWGQFTYFDEDSAKRVPPSILFADAKFGVSFPVGDPIARTFSNGLYGGAGIAVNLLKNRLLLKPRYGIQYFKNQPENNLEEKLLLHEAGLELSYAMFYQEEQGFSIGMLADFHYNWVKDYFVFQDEQFDVLSGEGSGITLGLKFKYRIFYLDLGYKLLELNAEFTEEERARWNAVGVTIFPVTVANMSSFSFCFGVSVPLYLFRDKSISK